MVDVVVVVLLVMVGFWMIRVTSVLSLRLWLCSVVSYWVRVGFLSISGFCIG